MNAVLAGTHWWQLTSTFNSATLRQTRILNISSFCCTTHISSILTVTIQDKNFIAAWKVAFMFCTSECNYNYVQWVVYQYAHIHVHKCVIIDIILLRSYQLLMSLQSWGSSKIWTNFCSDRRMPCTEVPFPLVFHLCWTAQLGFWNNLGSLFEFWECYASSEPLQAVYNQGKLSGATIYDHLDY